MSDTQGRARGRGGPRVGGAGCAGPARPRVRGSGTAVRPGRCGWLGRGPTLSEASARLFWPKVARAVLRKPPHAEESREAVLSLRGEKPRGPNNAS